MRDIPAPTREELSAYVDGEVDPVRNAEISYYLTTDEKMSKYVLSQRAIRDGLCALGAEVDNLLTSVKSVPMDLPSNTVKAAPRSWIQPIAFALSGAVAAAIVLAILAPSWLPYFGSQDPDYSKLTADTMFFLDQGARSYEFTPENTASINQVLPTYPDQSRFTPAIQAAGFHLKGGRITVMQGAGAILLVYEDSTGKSLGLTIWHAASDLEATAPKSFHGAQTIVWTDDSFSYALTGRQDPEVLEAFRIAYLKR